MARLGPHGDGADTPVGCEAGVKDQTMDQPFLPKTQFDTLRGRMMAGSLSAPSHVELAGGKTITNQTVVRYGLMDHLAEALDSLDPEERAAVEAQFLGKAGGDEITEQTTPAYSNAACHVRRGVEAAPAAPSRSDGVWASSQRSRAGRA